MKTKQFFLTALGTALLCMLVNCEQDAVEPSTQTDPHAVVQTGIKIDASGMIIIYARTQPFESEGLVVTELWSDGTEKPAANYTFKFPGDATRDTITDLPGTKVITVQSGNFSAAYNIQVNNSSKILTGITLASPPSKTLYEFGQNFDSSGMVINALYNDSSTAALNTYSVTGYERTRRGMQQITVTANRFEAHFNITLKIHAGAEMTANVYQAVTATHRKWYRAALIKGRPLPDNGLPEDLKITVKANGAQAVFTAANGDFSASNLSSFNQNQIGLQTLTLTLDDKTAQFPVYVIDVEPHVFFDYGYWRHSGQAEAVKGGATVQGGTAAQYTVPVNTELVITPVVFSMNTETPSYTWTCTAPHTTFGAGNKYLKVTPTATGTYSATVTVSAGNATGMSAATTIVCTAARPASQPAAVSAPAFSSPLPPVMNSGNTNNGAYIRNFAPGQFTKGGTGYGWSLGSIGGYFVWKLQKAGNGNINIVGNSFGGWNEPGIVWVSTDDNHNGIPDDTWYELKGSEDESAQYKNLITRSYGIRYALASGTGYTNEYGQLIQEVYWVDSMGRAGRIPGGFSDDWGVPAADNAWVEFGATLLRDDGHIDDGVSYSGHTDWYDWGYVDCGFKEAVSNGRNADRFYISDAIRADGTPANLPYIDFVRVQSGLFYYGGVFGEISTEINWGEGLGSMTNFASPN